MRAPRTVGHDGAARYREPIRGGNGMRPPVAGIHRPSRAARRRPQPASPGFVLSARWRGPHYLLRAYKEGHNALRIRTMSTAAAANWCYATVAPRSSTISASLGTPAPSSSSSSFRPRLIRNAPVQAAPVAPALMDAAVERLKTGFEKFKTDVYDKKPDFFEPLKAGQAPKYMVFACADSRVCPSVTLGLEPGEAFTVRNIANMVPSYCKNKYAGVGSAIEYAVCALKVEVIVVIGHSRCGGIKALLSLKDGADDSFHFVEDWVRIGFPAKKKVQADCSSMTFDDQCAVLEKEAVNVSLENLKTYPFVKEGVANGTLKLVGGHYDFVSGKFDTWEL